MRFLTPIILVIIAIVLFVTYINPTYGRIKEIRVEADQFDEALSRSQELIAVRDALLARYNAFPAEDLERLKKLLPDHVDNVRAILDIDNIAARYGMSLQDISIGESGLDEGADGSLGTDPNEPGSITMSFSVDASYRSFVQFLADLENSLRLLDVTQVSFGASEEDRATYNVTARMYWLK